MSDTERINKARNQARRFRELAQTSNSPETRSALMDLARRYDQLADHAEQQAGEGLDGT